MKAHCTLRDLSPHSLSVFFFQRTLSMVAVLPFACMHACMLWQLPFSSQQPSRFKSTAVQS